MMTNVFLRVAGVALALSLSTTSWAGGGRGGGMMIRPVHGMHVDGHAWGHGAGFAGSAGGARIRMGAAWGNRGYGHTFTALRGGGLFYGHTGTALRDGYSRGFAGPRFADRGRFGYGHPNTGVERLRPGARYAFDRRRYGYRYGYGTGVYGGDYGGYGTGAGSGVYDGSSGSVYVLGGGEAGSYGTTQTGAGYAEGPLGQGYAEAPLNAVGNGGYGGGPQILTVGGRPAHEDSCTCESPIIYRFGVGSYY